MRYLCGSCPGRLKLASRCACARVSFEIGQRSMSGHRANGPVRVMSLAPRQRGGTGARRVVHKKSATFSRATGERWPSRLVATAEENRLNVRAATLLRGHVGDGVVHRAAEQAQSESPSSRRSWTAEVTGKPLTPSWLG